jgi:hypothetical protein
MKKTLTLLALGLGLSGFSAFAQNYNPYYNPTRNGTNNGVYRNGADAQYWNNITGNSGSDAGRGHYWYNPFTNTTQWVPN